MKILSISAYQILDSRGVPTVEAEVLVEGGFSGLASVPSGASTGQYEAWELRDGDSRRFGGRSVYRAIENIQREIGPLLVGRDVLDQARIDAAMIELDGTDNKSRLGANAILAVSMAVARAAAAVRGVPLFQSLGQGTLIPLPEIQILGGGAHAMGRTDVQDFLMIATAAQRYADALEMTYNVYQAAGRLLAERGLRAGVADEGGYWPQFESNEQAIATLVEAISHAGYTPGRDVAISLDIAASDLWRDGRYHFKLEGRSFTSPEFAELMTGWCEKYPILSIEDPMADTDWDGWARVSSALASRVQLIGDDLFTTNLRRIEEGIRRGAANAVLIKLNQIGTVTETLAAISRTQKAGWLPVVSARSGETEDAFISHLAVATSAGQLKVGSLARGERTAKWNELLRIERRLGSQASFIGGRIYEALTHPHQSEA
jgi:enolase